MIKCNNCGAELILVEGDIKQEEFELIEKCETERNLIKTKIDPKIVNSFAFEKDEEVYTYFKNVFDAEVESKVLFDKISLDFCEKAGLSLFKHKDIVFALDEKNVMSVCLHP